METTILSPKAKKAADKFLQVLQNAYASGLQSVIIYGSVLGKDFNERASNINVLVVLDDTSPANLKKVSAALKRPELMLIEPLFFTQDYIRRSLDTFPIEFLDILDNHELFFGTDVFRGLVVDYKNLRFQCEQELKAKLIVIKSTFLRVKTKQELKSLVIRSFNSYIHIVRNLVRLKGLRPAYRKDEAIREFKEQFAIDTDTLDRLLDLKTKDMNLSYAQLESLLFDFIKELETIAKAVDEAE